MGPCSEEGGAGKLQGGSEAADFLLGEGLPEEGTQEYFLRKYLLLFLCFHAVMTQYARTAYVSGATGFDCFWVLE